MKKIYCALCAAFIATSALGSENGLEKAMSLYDNGLYAQAMNILQSLPQYGSDPVIDGYVTLCAYRQKSSGYQTLAKNYLLRYPGSSLCDDICMQQALDLFDRHEYESALEKFKGLNSAKAVHRELRAEFNFKKGYCYYKTGNVESALNLFLDVDKMPIGDYSAPAWYNIGYIKYEKALFEEALKWFEKSDTDERFKDISDYYIVNCNYELDVFDKVVKLGVPLYEDHRTPEDRKNHLARVISESFLVLGDKVSAKRYFAASDLGEDEKTRSDYFYAGSLMYTTGDWKGAIENYSKTVTEPDSLSQIAWYQMAFSNMKSRNRVAALDCFRSSSELGFDQKMQEDALFNYAKLAFDLNGDTSIFAKYIKEYSDKVRGEKIYSYMALAALQDRDWQSAIDAYDRIDVLEGQEKSNYVHANYLRGAELLEAGSYRLAMQCFKAVTYYTLKSDTVNQLARYALAETCYKNGEYDEARRNYEELYNASALYGMKQNQLLPYNIGYSLFKNGEYDSAPKWFDKYCNEGGSDFVKESLVRKADCHFAKKDYKAAAAAYQSFLDKYYDVNDIYPYYQCAMSCGLSKDRKMVAKKPGLLEKALDADPSSAYYGEALLELAKLQQSAKKTAAAAKTYTVLAEKGTDEPSRARALLELGTIRRNAGNADEALACYKKVVEELPASGCSEDALMAIESIYQSQGATKEYLAYLESVGKGSVKTDAEKEAMMFDAAVQQFYSNNYARAMASFKDYVQQYPESSRVTSAHYFIGECLRCTGDRVQACDAYRSVVNKGDSEYYSDALKALAEQSFALENFADSYEAYKALEYAAKTPAIRSAAVVGMMRSAYKLKNYEASAQAAQKVRDDALSTDILVREASMLQARSLLACSKRDEAYAIFEKLAENPRTDEGAESAYLIIQNCFDKAEFDKVTEKVYAFSGSGSNRQYWMAKSFIVLGDAFAEQGNFKQARATFQSIADNYSANDEIPSEVKTRLAKLDEMGK